MCRHPGALLAAGLLGLLVRPGAPAALAQDSAEVFGEALEVRVVNVEVVVTDGEGNRVIGLGREDFRLRVAGRLVPIDYFAEIREGRAQPAQDPAADSTPPPGTIPPGELVPTSYLVFLDEMFMVGAQRDRVLDRLEAQAALLGAVDRMAVVAFDGRRLEVLTDWRPPGPELSATLRAARQRPVHGLTRLAERRSLLASVDYRRGRRADFLEGLSIGQREAFGRAIAPDADGEQRAYAELLASQLGQIAGAAAGGMRALAEARGRKVVLLLSGGWHFEPSEAAADTRRARAAGQDRDVPGGEAIFAPLIETANLLGYTLYPIDVPGLEGQDLVEQMTASGRITEETPSGENAQLLLPEHAAQTSLLHLASRTGGRALLNDLRDQALRLPIDDTRSYYWLGFTPAWERDDEVSRIEIEVLRPGLRARFRRSLLDLSREAEATARLESYLYLDPPGHLSLPARVREIERAGRKEIGVSFDLAVPVRAVTFLPGKSGWEASLELRLLAVDVHGGRSETSLPLRLTSPRPPSPEGHVRHAIEVTLRNVSQDVVLAVYDRASGMLVANRLRIDPATTGPKAARN